MRIISGKAGGIALSVPKGEVRPTTDRVREALFSILNPLIGHADVLDLFTGSGAFGLEALSRGAGSSRMVDFSRLSCATAKANLAKTGLEGGAVIQGDAVQFVKRELLAGRKYDAFIPLASRNRACVQKKLEKYFFPYGWRREEDMTYTFYRK